MKKLYRSNNGTIAGICTGLGDYFEIDETIIKLIFAGAIFTPFPMITVYLIAWIIIPKSYE